MRLPKLLPAVAISPHYVFHRRGSRDFGEPIVEFDSASRVAPTRIERADGKLTGRDVTNKL